MRALEELARTQARVSLCVWELDRDRSVIAGDDFVTMPVAQLGIVPLLIEVAAGIEEGGVDPAALVAREHVAPASASGLWRAFGSTRLGVGDLAVLAAAASDPLATNGLIDLVGLDPIRARLEHLGFRNIALLDRIRDDRGPDDAPQFAISSMRDLTRLFRALANREVVSPEVSSRVVEWLALGADLGLAAAATGLDPLAHSARRVPLLLVNKTGRDTGVRAEAGVLAGPRAGVSYAMAVQFPETAVSDGLRVQEAFRVFGTDLMDFVH